MRLILARHGNTFAPQDKVFWVGARSDLPLVTKGHEQAKAIGKALSLARLIPDRIFAGPLKRTRETAEIAAESMGIAPSAISIVDELCEIDYGKWEGRSNDEIRNEYGEAEIDGWQKDSIFPEGFGWSPSQEKIRMDWSALMNRIVATGQPDDIVLIVSSNGIYRIVASALGLSPGDAKMDTGSLALLSLEGGEAQVERWNVAPETLSQAD